MFYVFYLEMNVFNIYGTNDSLLQSVDWKQMQNDVVTHFSTKRTHSRLFYYVIYVKKICILQ